MITLKSIRKNCCRKDGFSLVEVVVAASLVGISLAGIWGLISWLMYSTSITGRQTEATYLAEQRMEEILAGVILTNGTESVNGFARYWSISNISANQIDVEVQISWVDPRRRTNRVVMNSSLVNAVTSFTGVAFSDLFTGGPGP